MTGTVIGKHSDELRLEDMPSRNVATGEPWWRPRHRRDVLAVPPRPRPLPNPVVRR